MDRAQLIAILRCPETMQPVREATGEELAELNRRIASREIFNRTDVLREAPLAAALLRADGKLLFPVENEIPVMLLEEALVLC